jgi:hypothetical protein
MIDDVLYYLLTSDGIKRTGFGFILCLTLVFSILYFWRGEK